MKAIIELDVPEWQIGKEVTVYFPNTMMKRGKCKLLKEPELIIRCCSCLFYQTADGLCTLYKNIHRPEEYCSRATAKEG